MQTKLYQNTQQNVKLSTINEFNQNILSSQPVFDQKIEFDFSNALKSVNIPNALFVNFFKGKNDEMFKFTKKQLDLCQVFRHNFSRFSYFSTATYLNLFPFPFDNQKSF